MLYDAALHVIVAESLMSFIVDGYKLQKLSIGFVSSQYHCIYLLRLYGRFLRFFDFFFIFSTLCSSRTLIIKSSCNAL